ncbi:MULTISPECIES: CD225/dispanin family protein [Rhodococcus]|uniref:Interferon-induced transmembrane protein n=2 Tax=Rhodococcus TaxID=1827 RepID=A0A1H4IIR5_9NOCA|nr:MULTISPECIES: CD225/dispanin family protein [Rhodococcus]GCE38225.1 hypothetical protein Rhow_001264 [Rhodococcus wratislaviensis]SEB33526.1 Interferon-induced transmembrane protein [Rhodococcus koreensis]
MNPPTNVPDPSMSMHQDLSPPTTPSRVGPPSNIGWAVTALIFFWPLAFSAFSHSSKVLPHWIVGDVAAAERSSERARILGQLALLFGAVVAVSVLWFVATTSVMTSAGTKAW